MLRPMELAEVIRRRRAELGLSQADLAKAAGVDTRQIRRYEAGQQQPVLSVAVAIALVWALVGLRSRLRALEAARSTPDAALGLLFPVGRGPGRYAAKERDMREFAAQRGRLRPQGERSCFAIRE